MRFTFKAIVVILLVFSVYACRNSDVKFDDFDYSTTYFAWQYPVRTLVLGNTEYYDNSNDKNHRFEIRTSLGGMYANTKDRKVEFEIDNSLMDSLYCLVGADTVKLVILPSSYYEALTSNIMSIPKNNFNGGITIQLTDAFFNDPLACKTKYVLPLRILRADTDSILLGKKQDVAVTSPIASIGTKWGVDPRIAEEWVVLPKNFTIYAIKYVNQYQGTYLKRGVEVNENVVPNTSKGYGWENEYIERTTFTPKLTTISLNTIQYADMLSVSKLNFNAKLMVGDNNNILIENVNVADNVQITGTGLFTKDREEWGAKKRYAFYLDYRVTDLTTTKTYSVKDTLVFRDNGVVVETFTPIIKM